MFKGYDPDKRPPYVQIEIIEINDKIYKVTYLVGNGPAGSISISSSMELATQEYLDKHTEE